MLTIAGPTVATMASYTAMQFVDKLLVSRIGPEPVYVGAQGNGGLAAFVPMALAMGVLTIVNTYVSQNLGAGRHREAPAYAWNGMWLGLTFWLVALVPYGLFLPRIFAVAGVEPVQADLASTYGQILIFGACLTLSTRALAQFFYGVHRAGVIMVAALIANTANVVLSYALIFGVWGLPRLGMAGSAWGTVLATALELAIPLGVFLSPATHARFGTRHAWRFSPRHIGDLLRLGWPGGAMFGNEMICWAYFMVHLVSQFGTEHATAGWIAHQYMQISFMPAVGISVACTALVGRYMGMRRPDLAAQRARLGLTLAMTYMGLCGVGFVLFREPMVRLFIRPDTAPDAVARLLDLGSVFLIATAAFQLFDAMAMVITGALRGAGDTVVPGVATVLLSWIVVVGGGEAMVAAFPNLRSIGPWMAAATYIVVLALFLLTRYFQGHWQSIRLVPPPEPMRAAIPEGVVDGVGPGAELAPGPPTPGSAARPTVRSSDR